MRLDKSTLISGPGATAEVYAYGKGRVLKLFRDRSPHQDDEALAVQASVHASELAVNTADRS